MLDVLSRLTKAVFPFRAQKGQDRWVILDVLPFKRHGWFVDLAASDGKTHSNTYVLEKIFGWDGICIEPNPRFFSALTRARRCRVDNTVVDEVEGMVPFRIDNGQLGGIVATDTDNNEAVRGAQLRAAEILTLRAEPLASILERHNAPSLMDYFSLDVEGAEERTLRNFPFDRYTFRCATIERPTPVVNSLMFNAGYVFVRNVRYDTFYVHESALNKRTRCDPFEQVPPKSW